MLNLDHFTLLQGDCAERLKEIADESVDLIVTSPPYANQRKNQYSSTGQEEYVAWFLPIATELKRVLKPTGSFFLNIKSHTKNAERQLYVFDLVLALKRQIGFAYIDEYVWYKSALPQRWNHRLRDAWEPVYHFSKGINYINHEAIELETQCAFGNKRGAITWNSVTGNRGGYHTITDQQPGMTYPDNVLYFPTSLMVKDKFKHPAKFPVEMAGMLVRGFCPPGGMVLDCFLGSGTTALAALKNGMQCTGVEIEPEFCKLSLERLQTYVDDAEKFEKSRPGMYFYED